MVYINLKCLLICYLLKSVYGKMPQRECITSARSAAHPVSNGESVPDSYYPWHVSMFKRNIDLSTQYICGGSIISHDFILTAAHCLYEHDQVIIDDRLFIRVGSNRREGGEYIKIYKQIIHTDYKFGKSLADIALLQTLNVIQFNKNVRPICYTNTDFPHIDKDAWIPGWGSTENQAAGLTETLNHAKMPIRTRDDCEARDSDFYRDHVTDNSFCAGGLESTSLCFGDSGGGLVLERSDGWYIRGIASTAVLVTDGSRVVCDLTQFVVFTNVVSYADWIDDFILSKEEKNFKVTFEYWNTGASKSKRECDKYNEERPEVLQEKLANYDSSYRWVESAKEFPSHCFLQIISPYARTGNVGSCTLISNGWVITFASFVNLYPPTHVLLGAYNLWDYSDTGKLIKVDDIIIHDNFNPEISTHNIALVKFAEDVRFTDEIHPACLYMDRSPVAGTDLMFAAMDNGTSVLIQKDQKVLPTAECYVKHFSRLRSEVTDKQVCTFGVSRCACSKDFGEGLLALSNEKKRIFSLVGISSLISQHCHSNTATGYVRVSSYLKWIERYVWPD